MIDHPRSSGPESQGLYRAGSQSNTPPGDDEHRKKPLAGQVDIIAMVRSLQRTAGTADCFRMGNADCDNIDCDWRTYCLGQPAERKKTAKRPKRI